MMNHAPNPVMLHEDVGRLDSGTDQRAVPGRGKILGTGHPGTVASKANAGITDPYLDAGRTSENRKPALFYIRPADSDFPSRVNATHPGLMSPQIQHGLAIIILERLVETVVCGFDS